MNKTQTNEINKHADRIKLLDKDKLCLFTQELFLSKTLIDEIVFKEILALCDYRMAELKGIVSVMVVESEMSAGDQGL